MLHIYCPHCDEHREEEEFRSKGEAHIARPPEPESASDEDWGNYLFFRKNPRGLHHEQVHRPGTLHLHRQVALELQRRGQQAQYNDCVTSRCGEECM